METMQSMLYEAALIGSVPTLLELLQQDQLIIDRVAVNCLSESPLHAAALLGHVDFEKEIIRQKPELAGELDSNQQKGHVDKIKALLQVNPALCFARDLDGRNPLHLAAMKGRIDVLEEFFRTRLLGALVTTIWGKTILRLCVIPNQLDPLKFLMDNIDDPQFLNAEDDMAWLSCCSQLQVIRFLTTRTMIDGNALNANGFTALDVLAQSKRDIKDWEIGELIRHPGAYRAKDVQLSANEQTNSLISPENNSQNQHDKGLENSTKKLDDDWLEKNVKCLNVGGITDCYMAFQARANPPQ